MKNMRQTAFVFISLLLVSALLSLADVRSDDNCFTVIVGKKASVDGSVLIGHNDDDRGDIIVNLRKIQARDYGGPRTTSLGRGGTFETDGKTNAFLWVEGTTQEFADSFINQYSVVITSDSCPSRETRDDLTDGGIGYMLRRILAEKAKSARDAVKIAGELVEKFGYRDSGRTYSIADRNEAWMMAIIRGRHWFAERIPDDEVAVIPNYYTIRRIRPNDGDYFMGSRDIVEYARKNGWYDEAKDGSFDFKKAFVRPSGRGPVFDGNSLRQWRGVTWLSGRKWEITGDYPFSFKPGRKITAESLMEILRDHYEGTEYDATDGYKTGTPNRTKFRTICTASTIYSFIASLSGKRPEPISAALWLALGKPDTTVYLPLYYGVENLPPGAGLGIRTHDDEVFYRQHFDDAEFKAAKGRLLQTKILELQKIVEANYGQMIETVRRELSPAEKTFVRDRAAFESDFSATYAKNEKEAAKKLDESIAAAFDKVSLIYGKLLASSAAAADTAGNRRESLGLTAGEFKVSFSANGALLAVERKGSVLKTDGPDTAGEIILKDHSFPLTKPVSVEEREDGLHFIYEVALNPRLRVELVHRLTQTGLSVSLSRAITLVSSGVPSGPASQTPPAKFGADLTVRLPLAPFKLPPETWLPRKDGVGRPLADDKQAAYRFAGALRSSGVPLAIPMVSFVSKEFAGRVTVAADPYYSTLFAGDAVEWTYPESVGLENGRESRSLSLVFHPGSPDDAVAEFFRSALPDVPPGPRWLHDIAMVDYDYLSEGGRGWFKDIDALSAAIPREDRSKVLLCLHGWYDFVGRYTFDRQTKTLASAWTAFANYPNVKKDFPSNVPVALTLKAMHDRLAYARSRGFRVALYFADGLNAGEGLADIYSASRVLKWGGWQGPDTKGRTYVQNPLCPEVRGFFLDYVKALLREYGNELDALVWDETFHVPEGSLGSEAHSGYADRAMMRLTADITAEVRAFDRRAGREVAFMASDCIGVFNWVTKPPYALVADGTYQDTHCAPEAWPYGVFPNFRNVLWSCNWEPVTHWDYTEFGVRSYQTPVAISNGWGDYCGFAAMSPEMKKKVLALFDWRKRFAARFEVLDKLPVYEGNPIVKSVADDVAARIPFLSWDTEGGDKVDTNLLRPEAAVKLQFLDGRAWRDALMNRRRAEDGGAVFYELEAGKAHLTWRIDPGAIRSAGGDLTLVVTASEDRVNAVRLLFPFDPKVTPTTVLPGEWRDDGTFRLPAVINAPDFGPMLIRETGGREVRGRLEGSRKDKIDDLTLELPEITSAKSVTLTLTPLLLAPPSGLRDGDLWRAARRGWLNALQPCARWGEQGKPFSSPPGILGNNVISDPASISLWFYADQAFFTPEIAPGVSLMALVRRTIDYWLDGRMRRDDKGQLTGEITGYWDYGNFLDANASPLISAWDYVEATGDLAWLKARIERLELVADFLARRDIDGDGFVEAVQSGNRGTLVQPNRSCSWWDALNCGHKDGYTNALIYRAWRSLADLEQKLGRAGKSANYTRLADRLKAVYCKTLFNPQTGWLAWWKSADGELHDYASPTLNGLAIEYGLVEPALGRQILDRIWKKMAEAGFTRFDLGVPPMLSPVSRSDYLQPDAIGIPKREDGTDTFGWYMNGGITAGHVLHFLAAHYVLGEGERADGVLRAMLERQARGEFEDGVRDAGGEGIDWTTWEGKPSGYEGYLADSFRFLQAVLLREPEFRARLYRPLLAAPREDPGRSAAKEPVVIEKGDFRFACDERGLSALADLHDPFGATLMPGSIPRGGRGAGRPQGSVPPTGRPPVLGLTLSYRAAENGAWKNIAARGPDWKASPAAGTVIYTNWEQDAPLRAVETYETDGHVLDWKIDLESTGPAPVRVGDLGISIPVAGPYGEDPAQIFERGFLRHQFISGAGSFIYFVRASGEPPYLLVTVQPGTKLEYMDSEGFGAPRFFVHSSRTGAAETRGTWRQAHTALDLAPAGQPGSRAGYGFRMQWAGSYDELREMLYQTGLFDVRVVPGMTVPEDLGARLSLHTKAKIEAILAEFPGRTTIRSLGEPAPGHRVWELTFRKLGENMLTIVHDGGRRTFLEFFVTEPMETLIKKRAAFIVARQQVKDPAKWWDGVYGPYDMMAKVTRTIDDPDIFLDRMVYVLTCDDPGLCKAPFIAAKNVVYPDKKEIESLEYYLEHFVWGKLQRRGDEQPYPYGVYGTPNWYVNRDPARRKAYAESLRDGATAIRDLGQEHVWRSYDYPHVIMLYFHMYQIAKMYPEMSKYLDAGGYLNRAWETARAFYTYPYEIYPTYYETYKWGLYNELVVLDLIRALEAEGFSEQAAWLRGEWEKKVKYFVYDDRYPFRSEYAFDRTAFESTYAFAKYGATRDMKPDRNLWYDIKLKKWYSHPNVRREDSRLFMDRQLVAGLSVRGWLNPAFYTLGCDPGVSYMAAMGGWGVLDYALNFAPRPFDWLQLGYASYLSSWCLMNTGRPETGYGYWCPGPENDGASGWQFQTAKAGGAWMGSSVPGGVTVPRGPWRYDGEIDLGYGGALRMAATVVTRDPIFGWIAYGGKLEERGAGLSVNPRDGIRRRLDFVVPGLPPRSAEDITRLKIELERDGFAANAPITMDKALRKIMFLIENRTANAHKTGLRLSPPVGFTYELVQDGRPVPLIATGDWDYPWRAELEMAGPPARVELTRKESR